MNFVYCRGCAAEIHETAPTCPKCGAAQGSQSKIAAGADNRGLITLALCFFLGIFGAHRFYVGKTGTAVAMLLTLGGFLIWNTIDFIMILLGKFTDRDGNIIKIT